LQIEDSFLSAIKQKRQEGDCDSTKSPKKFFILSKIDAVIKLQSAVRCFLEKRKLEIMKGRGEEGKTIQNFIKKFYLH